MTSWKNELRNSLKGRLAVMGIGNTLRADDALGPQVASSLPESDHLRPFCCEAVPEKWIAPLRRSNPDVILIVDVADFGGIPGEIRLLETADLLGLHSPSTHGISPGFLMEHFTDETGAPSFMLAVQPRSLELGAEMSEECRRAADEIIRELSRYPF